MIRRFEEIEDYIIKNKIKKTIALCGSHDDAALSAVVDAKRKGIVDAILIGDEEKTKELLTEMGEPIEDYEFENVLEERKAARKAVKYVVEGRADFPMKGIMQTESFLMALVNPIIKLVKEDGIVSHVGVFYYPDADKLIFITDAARNISPTVEDKKRIINNAVEYVRAFGHDKIRVAVLSAVEFENPAIPSTMDAAELSKMEWPEDVIVEGPYALDNALSEESAKHKGISGEVAGKADIVVVPDLNSGNVLYKAVTYIAHHTMGGTMLGTGFPSICASRADSPLSKYYSILLAIFQSEYIERRKQKC